MFNLYPYLLYPYLFAVSAATGVFDGDGKLNAADLTLMKRMPLA